MSKLVACIVLNYNDYETTADLVNKIKEYKELDYVIVVDNCSTDDSYMKLKKFEKDQVIVISSGKNGGYGYGNNCGLRYAIDTLKCEYCIVANPDVLFEESVVPRLVDFMDNNDEYAVAVPLQSGTLKQAWKKTGVMKDQLFYSLILNKIFNPRYYPDEYFQNKICNVYAVKGCFLMFRANAIKDVDYYDEDFFLFEEEKVIAYKLEQKNYKSAVLTDISYIHNHSVTIKKNFKRFGQSKRLVLKSNELFLRKYMGVGKMGMFFVKIYHSYCIIESIIFESLLSIFK